MPEDFAALRVVDLKEECKKRNLTVGGKKAELIARLEEFEAGQDGAGEAAAQAPAEASDKQATLPSGTSEDAEAAADDIIEADKLSEDVLKPSDDTAAEAVAAASPKKNSKVGASASKAKASAQPTTEKQDAADTGNNVAVVDAEKSSDAAKQLNPEPEQQSSVKPSATKEPAGVTEAELPTSTPVLKPEVPAVEAPETSASDATALKPATEVPTASPDADAAGAQLDAITPKEPAQAGAAAMDIDSAQVPDAMTSDVPEKDSYDAHAAEPKTQVAVDAADTAAADAVPLVAALTDAGMGEAHVAGDTEMVQYDERSDDEQAAPPKDSKPARAKPSAVESKEGSKQPSKEAPSTSKAAKDDSAPHASARKRGREADEAVREDRKAPRTERQSDVKLSQREKEREREKERSKDSKQANGDAPLERKRKHAPISYKPPERTPSQADKDKTGLDASRRESRTDKKASEGGSGLERAVSRTESGHKLSVFERLQRGKGERGSGSAPSARREPIPAPSAPTSKEPLPRTSSHSRRNQPSQALRIDGFVRPLTVPKTEVMLSAFGKIKQLWMPSMKTHAFVVFATAEQAENCLKATAGINWPPGNKGSMLSPKFVTVEEAETAIARAGGGSAPDPANAPSANGLAARHSSAALDAAIPDAAAAPSERRAGLDEPRRSRDALDDRRRPRESDSKDRQRALEDGGRPARDAGLAEAAPEPQVDPPTLDELFRKTTTKPCLYWIPLTEEQAVERKTKLEAAAAAAEKAAAGEVAIDLAVPVVA